MQVTVVNIASIDDTINSLRVLPLEVEVLSRKNIQLILVKKTVVDKEFIVSQNFFEQSCINLEVCEFNYTNALAQNIEAEAELSSAIATGNLDSIGYLSSLVEEALFELRAATLKRDEAIGYREKMNNRVILVKDILSKVSILLENLERELIIKLRSINMNTEQGISRLEVAKYALNSYSQPINLSFRTLDEPKVYKTLGLKEGKVNGKTVLKDISINPSNKDAIGRSNLERMKRGLAPLDNQGESYNLHHIGQKQNSPLVELKNGIHKSEYSSLHNVEITKSEIDRDSFDKERAAHWKARAKEIEESSHV